MDDKESSGSNDVVKATTTSLPPKLTQEGDFPDNKTVDDITDDDYDDVKDGEVITITPAMKCFALCAALNSCNLGYDIGVSTNVGYLIQKDWDMSDVRRELLVGSINLWAIFGALGSAYFSDRFGRRRTFLVAAIGFIFGSCTLALATNWTMVMIGRCFVGLGMGVGMAIDPVYIAEMSPAKFRGYLVTWSEIAINVGVCMGYGLGVFVGFIPNTSVQWRLMLLCGAIMPAAMIYLVTYVMPESPRWLVSQNRDEEAREILQMTYQEGFDVDGVVSEIKEAVRVEAIAENHIGWSIILHPTPAFRRMLIVGIGVAVAQQLSGIDAIQYYILDVLDGAGIKSDMKKSIILICLGLTKLVLTIMVGNRLDSRGRRPFMLASLLGMSTTLFIMAMIFSINETPGAAMAILCLGGYLCFFGIGLGPGAWLIPSEIFATSIRAKAMSVATTLNRFASFVMSSTFLTAESTLGWDGFLFLLGCICLCLGVFIYFFLPETKERSLEQMAHYFAEVTGDKSILEAEKQLKSELELGVIKTSSGEENRGGIMA